METNGEMFTDRCRKMLAEQPDQSEFTLSRAGLETLVLDSERYGASNAERANVASVGATLYVNRGGCDIGDEKYECYTVRGAYRDAYSGELFYRANLNWTPDAEPRVLPASRVFLSKDEWLASLPDEAA